MANHAYLSVWSRDFSEANILRRWEEFLGTVPFSAAQPGFANLVIRAVNETETPLIEEDLRSAEGNTGVLVQIASEHRHGDCCYETRAYWDLWTTDQAGHDWAPRPQPLTICCRGEQFDEAVWVESGHFLVDLGFEHFFTGHAGMLGFGKAPREQVSHPQEANFVDWMSRPDNLRTYNVKTRENIRRVYDWIRDIQEAIPVERYLLQSEGEENIEARMDEILATR